MRDQQHNTYMRLFSYFTLILLFFASLVGCQSPEPAGIPVIIDADTANEVDDLFALVRAISAPALNIKGITSAQFHTSPLATDTTVLESQTINRAIIRLMDRNDILLPIGSNAPLHRIDVPQVSPASNHIVKTAQVHSPTDPLHLIILGSCTNVASAILQDPKIIPNIEVHYLGFWHDTLNNVFDRKEFNSGNDTLAIEFLMTTPNLKMDVMTATTSQHLTFSKANVDRYLKNKGGIADYLTNRWESYNRWWTEDDPKKTSWVMWDVAIIEALIHPEWATKKPFNTKPDGSGRMIEAYTSIDVDAMRKVFWDMFSEN